MKQRKYTDEDVKLACTKSTSYSQVLSKLNLKPAGGNHALIKLRIKKLGIDISHFKAQGWNKGQTVGPKRPLDDYLKNRIGIQSNNLKKRLINENILTHICSNCNNDKWLEKPIPLELDHKDGNHFNNELSNLRLLCPNCHALTSNYRGKNKNRKPT